MTFFLSLISSFCGFLSVNQVVCKDDVLWNKQEVDVYVNLELKYKGSVEKDVKGSVEKDEA